jgi:hypothetical protein
VIRSWVFLLLGACSWVSGGPQCSDPTQTLAVVGAQSITCGEGEVVRDYASALAGRPLNRTQRANIDAALARDFEADAAGTLTAMQVASAVASELRSGQGVPVAEVRSTYAWALNAGEGPFGAGSAVQAQIKELLVVWAHDDEARLVLMESDIEGVISYASLCSEVQGAGALRLALSDRQVVYAEVEERFRAGSRADKVALVAFGPFWSNLSDRWQQASYQQQQAWAKAAPLPPPMVGSSLGYLSALLDVATPSRHAAVLHDQLGPVSIDGT